MDRRSFLAGLLGGTVVGGCGLMLVQSIPYPNLPVVGGLTQFVSDDGATQPFLSTAIFPAAIYDSDNDTTWMAWESWNGTTRIPRVTGYDHSTGYFTPITEAGQSGLTDDDHGTPAICLDEDGYLHVFYGNHISDQRYSTTQVPIAGADTSGLWRVNDPITGQYTYPHPVVMGSDIYLFLRKFRAGPPNHDPFLVLRKTASLVNGVATWDGEIELVDFGLDSRFYQGTVLKNGTDIWIVATRADSGADTARKNVYLFVYDTTTGAVKNHDGSFSVASGSLPVTLTDADTNYRLFEHTGSNHDGGAPGMCFDTNGDPHILFKDGTGNPTGTFDVKHIMRSSGTWTSPTTIATVDNRYNCPVPVALSSGRVEAWYTLDPGGAFTRFGNMVRRTRSAAGVWGAEQTILEADTVGLGNPTIVLNGDSSARVMFSEALDDPADSGAGDLRVYLYGDGGLIPYAATPVTPGTSGETLQLNAENLQLNTEDLTLGA